MSSFKENDWNKRPYERGGIAIMVALILITLLTVMSLSLARSSIREIAITGTSYRATQTNVTGDSGLDWAVTWLAPENRKAALGVAPGATPQKALADLTDYALGKIDTTAPIAGASKWVNIDAAKYVGENGGRVDSDISVASDSTFKLYLSHLGVSSPPLTEQVDVDTRNWPGLWRSRSDGTHAPAAGALNYTQSRELVLTTPAQ
jgi:type II secretory pathway component PulK